MKYTPKTGVIKICSFCDREFKKSSKVPRAVRCPKCRDKDRVMVGLLAKPKARVVVEKKRCINCNTVLLTRRGIRCKICSDIQRTNYRSDWEKSHKGRHKSVC